MHDFALLSSSSTKMKVHSTVQDILFQQLYILWGLEKWICINIPLYFFDWIASSSVINNNETSPIHCVSLEEEDVPTMISEVDDESNEMNERQEVLWWSLKNNRMLKKSHLDVSSSTVHGILWSWIMSCHQEVRRSVYGLSCRELSLIEHTSWSNGLSRRENTELRIIRKDSNERDMTMRKMIMMKVMKVNKSSPRETE